MAFDWGGISGVVFSWLSSFMFWGIFLVAFLFGTIGLLILKKRRKLKFPVIEITGLGAGKVGLLKHKGGWFRSKTFFFGLWDYGGDELFRLKDGREVQGSSSEDYHDIFGRRGLIVQRKGDDPKILLPISEIELDEDAKHALISIAPGDFRDASTNILRRAENETRGTWEKILPWIALGGLGIILFICIILIVQMVKNGQAEASKLILEAGKIVADSGKGAIASGAP